MDTNYKLTATHIERARSMALLLATNQPSHAKAFALLQRSRHAAGSLGAAFWQYVALEAGTLELLCCQPA
jgi:hypothetical protein